MTCRTCHTPIEPGAYLPWRHTNPLPGRGHYARPSRAADELRPALTRGPGAVCRQRERPDAAPTNASAT